MQISQLFMFQATHTWFIVAQVMSFGEWLSIIARSELGSDLDCSVINARSELGSDLDCYELNLSISVFCLENIFIYKKYSSLRLNYYGYAAIIGLQFSFFQCEDRLYTSESDKIANMLVYFVLCEHFNMLHVWYCPQKDSAYASSKKRSENVFNVSRNYRCNLRQF